MVGISLLFSNPFLSLLDNAEQSRSYRDTEVLSALTAMCSTPPGIREFFGLPGMGKSTLLRYLADPHGAVAQNREWLNETWQTNPSRLFLVLVRYSALPRAKHPLVLLYETFRETWAEQSTFDKGILAPSLGADELVGAIASQLLDRDVRKLNDHQIRTVFLLDDFDVAFERLSPTETTSLRPLREFACFILVTERSLIYVNERAAGSPFIQSVAPRNVSSLLPEEAYALIDQTTALREVAFPPEDTKLLMEYSGGHPYLLILAAKTLWEMREQLGILNASDKPLGEPWSTGLTGRLEGEYRRTFLLYWDNLDRSEQQVVKMIAKHHESEASGGRTRPRRMDDLQIQTADDLVFKGLLKRDIDVGYELFSPLFEAFVLEASDGLISGQGTAPELSDLEARLYGYLREHAGEVCSFGGLWDVAWTTERPYDDGKMKHIVNVTISRIRKQLRLAGITGDIYSVRGVGYRYEPR